MKVSKAAQRRFLQDKLSTSPKWAYRALVIIYNNQTPSEQDARVTLLYNNIGFTGADAEILTALAEHWIGKGWFSPKQSAIVMRKMKKYWRQLLEVSDVEKLNQMIVNE